jgi:voltage-gated potassium channel
MLALMIMQLKPILLFVLMMRDVQEGDAFTPFRTFVTMPMGNGMNNRKDNYVQKLDSSLFVGTADQHQQDEKLKSISHEKDNTAGSNDRNGSMFFASASVSSDEDQSRSRPRGAPLQFYIMTHDERSCTVTAEQFAYQMIGVDRMDNSIKFDVSIPYDAAALYYYEKSDKDLNFDEFNRRYLSNSIALVKSKQIEDDTNGASLEVDAESTSTTLLNYDEVQSKDTLVPTLPFGKEIADLLSQPQAELVDAGLVLLSSFLVAIGTLPAQSLPDFISTGFFEIEEVLSCFFCFGFFMRWYSVGNLSPKYFTKPLPLIDFIASVVPLALTTSVYTFGVTSVPVWLMTNSALVNLRLLRLLRLQELLIDIDTFKKVAEAVGIKSEGVRPYQLQLTRVVITIFSLLSVSSGLIYTAEHEVNPAIPDYFTALYFGLTTLTTVGFGDINPVTLPGRLVVMGSILVGVAIIPAQGAELVEALLDFQTERRQKKLIKTTLRTRTDGGGYENDAMVDPRISCASCGKRNHRGDAFYCWSCGSKLWQ